MGGIIRKLIIQKAMCFPPFIEYLVRAYAAREPRKRAIPVLPEETIKLLTKYLKRLLSLITVTKWEKSGLKRKIGGITQISLAPLRADESSQ
ncbi:unnamed protein product [marine sediment metagenome]|uniref:Uncharacterized protein n=1 Tax=marine sediment metagenome TaxID=412755 RepID=X1KRQ2_9ZZZZ